MKEPVCEVYGVPIFEPDVELANVGLGIPTAEKIQSLNERQVVDLGAGLKKIHDETKRAVQAYADALKLCGDALKNTTQNITTPAGNRVTFRRYLVVRRTDERREV